MRSQLSRIAGSGTLLAFVEVEDNYRDQKVLDVRMPSDQVADEDLVSLSGPVTSYNLYSGSL